MAATDAFEPGSTFKLFTVASLLSRAVCDTAQRYDGLKRRPGQKVATKWLGPGFAIRDVHAVGVVSLRHAFTTSSNIIFATASEGLRRREFDTDLRRFGIGSLTGSGWPAETAGKLRSVEHWSDRSLGTLAIGQELSVSLMQLVAGYAALVGDGNLRTPRFVDHLILEDGTRIEPASNLRRERVIPRRVTEVLRALCRDVVDAEYGTGTHARLPGLDIGGKTGTAQISDRTGYLRGVYTPSFVGFLPADEPKLVVAIVLHRAEGEEVFGGNSAAPCFRRIVQKIASCTSYLDAGDGAPVVVASETVRAPSLIGRTAADIAALDHPAWLLAAPAPGPGARVVGQIPPPGSRMARGAEIQVAWWEGGR